MSKRFEKWGTTEIIQDKRYAWSLEKICDYMNENFDKITDLEAKLAEKERDFDLLMLSKNEEINEWIAVRDDKNKVIDRQTDKINELKQQLAEKDKKIKSLTLAHFESEKNKPILTTTEIINQVKIELLERLKSMIKADYDNHFPDFPLGIVEKKHIEYIDTLIKEIKGE